jgi:hypothetical protein
VEDYMVGLNLKIDEKVRIKPFEWEIQFSDIIKKGGFDCIIGNPPYIRSITLKESDKFVWGLYKEFYESAKQNEFDIYLPFLERSSKLINQNGLLSFIMPNKWLHATMGNSMRNYFIKTKLIKEIVNFKSYQVFENATNYTMIITLNGLENKSFQYYIFSGSSESKEIKFNFNEQIWENNCIDYSEIKSDTWNFQNKIKSNFLNKLSKFKSLDNYLKIKQGTGTRADGIFFVTKINENRKEYRIFLKETQKEYWVEKIFFKPTLKGKDIEKYSIVSLDNLLFFPYNGKNLVPLKDIRNQSPKLYNLLLEYRKNLETRENGRWKGNSFHCYGRPQNHEILPKHKILRPAICNSAEAVWDDVGYYVIDSIYIADIIDERFSPFYYTALLNSNILTFFLKQTGTNLRGGYFTMKTNYLKPFPVVEPEKKTESQIVNLVENILELNKKLNNSTTKLLETDKTIYKQEKVLIEKKINILIYQLYDLTLEEIKIVEGV